MQQLFETHHFQWFVPCINSLLLCRGNPSAPGIAAYKGSEQVLKSTGISSSNYSCQHSAYYLLCEGAIPRRFYSFVRTQPVNTTQIFGSFSVSKSESIFFQEPLCELFQANNQYESKIHLPAPLKLPTVMPACLISYM